MTYLRAMIFALLTVGSVSKATVWTYKYLHHADPVTSTTPEARVTP